MADGAVAAAHGSGDGNGLSWLVRLLRRPAWESEPQLAPSVPVPRPARTREQIIERYTSMVQGIVDDDPAHPPSAVSVCGVGPMTINVYGNGRVFLTPRASMQ